MTIAIQSGIYCIRNIHDGKRYVGQAANIEKRKQQHFSALAKGKHHCVYLQRSFTVHGESAFVHEILEIVTDGITSREQYWMDHFRASSGTYNTAPAAGSPLGIKRSAYSVEKMAASKRGKKLSEETKQKMRDTHAKMKEFHHARAKSQWSDEAKRLAKSAQMKGGVASDATKLKLSEVSKTRWADPAYKARLSAKQKIAQSLVATEASSRMKAKWANPEFRSAMMAARQQKASSSINAACR